MISPAVFQTAASEPVASQAHFDIPAQPLSDALYAYSTQTGIDVLVPAEMLANRRSSVVTGAFDPAAALHMLLSGTGLISRPTGAKAFTLALVPPPRFPAGRVPLYSEYSAELQAALKQVLCQLAETRPGGYRIAARLWVGQSGAVTQVRLRGTTGDTGRDTLLSNLFQRVLLSTPPPAQLPQPTTLVVLPRQVTGDCAGQWGVRP